MDSSIKWIKLISKLKFTALILIIIIVENVEGNADDASSSNYGSQCFHVKGVPTLKLRCSNGELIRVEQSFYGTQTGGRVSGSVYGDEAVCQYNSTGQHCIQLTDMHENCMGRYMCSVYVSNPFLMNCRTYASYMQVNYTCISRYAIHDICEPKEITMKKGYIRSPQYPDANYTSNAHCGCRLETKDPGIVLNILDFSVNHTSENHCDTDYLRVGHWGKKCGQIGPERLPESLNVDRQKVNLEFHSDDKFTSRGFWMEYKGSNGGDVTVSCGQIIQKPVHNYTENTDIQDYTIMQNSETTSTDQLNVYSFNDLDDVTQNINHVNNFQGDGYNGNKIKLPVSWPPFSNGNNLPNVFSEMSDEENYQGIHPKHLENANIVFNPAENNVPVDSETNDGQKFVESILYHEQQDQHGNREIDIAREMILDENQKKLHSKLYSGLQILETEAAVSDTDTIYTPHTGPWDIPKDDGYMQNMVIKGDWNDEEETGLLNHSFDIETLQHPDSLSISSEGRKKEENESQKPNNEFDVVIPVDTVKIITGVVVGFLILVAVIIIIVLVFRRYPSRF